MIHIKPFAIASLSLVLLASCGSKETAVEGNTEETISEVTKDTTPVTVDDVSKFKFDFALANIPSPAVSIEELSKWGIDYDQSLMNDTKKSKNYSSEFQKAVNLGIYNIDMCYAIVNERGEDVLKFMKTVLITSDALGLKGAVDQMIGKRAEQNLGSKDSLLKILDEILIKSDSYLRTNERLYTASTVFSGGWLESLYLTCKLTDKTNDEAVKARGRKHLWEQRFHLGNLVTVMDDHKDKKEAQDMNSEFRAIHKMINNVKQPEDMTPEKYKKISEQIYALRTKLVM
jgi:hypothetical protein